MTRQLTWKSPVVPLLLVAVVVLVGVVRGAFGGAEDPFESFPSIPERLVQEADVHGFLGRTEPARCERSHDEGRNEQSETCRWGAPEAGQLTVAVVRYAAESTATREFRRPIVPPDVPVPELGDEAARSADLVAEPEVKLRRHTLVASVWYVRSGADPNERMPDMLALAHVVDRRLDPIVA
ncbi:hypothetical protein ABTX15_19895 [Micromonospora sp. NPDC094482]|uniref:hypothetical protein n=1 Tax=unclassified Micromonospora TaxID=2617518 RepID=UPI003320DCF8